MKQVTTITLTFKFNHISGDTSIESIRKLIDKLSDYCGDRNVEVISNDDTDDYTFVEHAGRWSRQFRFDSIDSFVMKYGKFGAGDIAALLRDYGNFVGCDSKTEEMEDVHSDKD